MKSKNRTGFRNLHARVRQTLLVKIYTDSFTLIELEILTNIRVLTKQLKITSDFQVIQQPFSFRLINLLRKGMEISYAGFSDHLELEQYGWEFGKSR